MPDNNSLENALTLAEASSFANDDKTLVIDNNLRTIRVPTSFVFGVYNDKDVLSVPFEMPRYYDDIDLSDFSIRINYRNAIDDGGIYEVPSKTVESDLIKFEWLLGENVFVSAGTVRFIVCLRKIEGSSVVKEFNTTIATGTVLQGLEIEDQEAVETATETGSITIGNTVLTETQLISLLQMLE